MTHIFGTPNKEQADPIKAAMDRSHTLYSALFDRQALWDPATIDKVIESFPKDLIEESDLFLILAECIANSVLHGQADVLGFQARQRKDVILLSFYQIPPIPSRVGSILELARKGQIRECAMETPGGLGFPILLRLAHKITISMDYNRLQIWIRAQPKATEKT